MAGLLPNLGDALGASSSAPLPAPILGGQTGAGTGTPSAPFNTSVSRATRVQSSSASADRTPLSSAPPRSTPTPSVKPTPSLTPTPSGRPLTTFIISTTTSSSSVPTPSLSDTPPLPSPTSIPVVSIPPSVPPVVPISTPEAPASPIPTFIPPPPESTPIPIPTPTPTPTPQPSVIAAPSQAEQSGGGGGARLMPALPIALGSVGGVLIFGLVIGMLYRKGRWPFGRRRRFAELDEMEVERQQELERQQKMKW
ncbi:hypothetical protein CMUS01_14896, partial [Colletotrichum musicola]